VLSIWVAHTRARTETGAAWASRFNHTGLSGGGGIKRQAAAKTTGGMMMK
jgi:hypothetical protein